MIESLLTKNKNSYEEQRAVTQRRVLLLHILCLHWAGWYLIKHGLQAVGDAAVTARSYFNDVKLAIAVALIAFLFPRIFEYAVNGFLRWKFGGDAAKPDSTKQTIITETNTTGTVPPVAPPVIPPVQPITPLPQEVE